MASPFLEPRGARQRLEALQQLVLEAQQARRDLTRQRAVVRTVEWRRDTLAVGDGNHKCFLFLLLIQRAGGSDEMVQTIAKLTVPQSVWSRMSAPIHGGVLAALHARLARDKVQSAADCFWANRFAPRHRCVWRRLKRLMAEFHVFKILARLNGKGVAPKRRDLVAWLRAAWVYTDVGGDALPRRLHVLHKARKWSAKFRRFWGVTWSKIPARAMLSADDQARKVLRLGLICEHDYDSVFGAGLRPPNLVPSYYVLEEGVSKWGRFSTSFLGPFCVHEGEQCCQGRCLFHVDTVVVLRSVTG